MKLAWPLAMVLALLLISAPAEARKECRSADPVAATPDEEPDADANWPHDASSDWVHAGDDAWVHEDASGAWVHEDVRYDSGQDAGWVHETDYGWWAAVPDEVISEIEEDFTEESEEDCTVSRERNECVVLANQIATYEFRLGLAIERENEVWEESLRATIERLETRGERYSCPWVEPSLRVKIEQTVEAVSRAVGVAAQVAAMMYRMGLF